MTKPYVNHDQLTQASNELRKELVDFCKANKIYTWKTSKEGMERIEPDEYNLPLFSYGQLLAFLLPMLKDYRIESIEGGDGVITYVNFKDPKFGIVDGMLVLGSPTLQLEPIDALWGVILHYGEEIRDKEKKSRTGKDVKNS